MFSKMYLIVQLESIVLPCLSLRAQSVAEIGTAVIRSCTAERLVDGLVEEPCKLHVVAIAGVADAAVSRLFKDGHLGGGCLKISFRGSDLRRHEKPVSTLTSALETGFHAGIGRNADLTH